MGPRRAEDAVRALLRWSAPASNMSPARRRLPIRRLCSLCASASQPRPRNPGSEGRIPRFRDHAAALRSDRRDYSSPAGGNDRIAVIGGGLTGLTTAYYLAKRAPESVKITLYESSSRLGGWVRTNKVPVDVHGKSGIVSFEQGPRSVPSLHNSTWRFDDLVLYDIVLDLGLPITLPKDVPRYVYFGDRLVQAPPSSFLQALREPLYRANIVAGLGYLRKRFFDKDYETQKTVFAQTDPSIATWLEGLTGSNVPGDNLVSAIIHGVHGGNIDKLSAMETLDSYFHSYLLPSPRPDLVMMPSTEVPLLSSLGRDKQIQLLSRLPKGSLLSFGKHGLEAVVTGLVTALEGQPNVEVKLNEPIENIRPGETAENVQITTTTSTHHARAFDKVISTVTPKVLTKATGASILPSMAKTEYVSMMVVSFWFPFENMKPFGAGYLIPRSIPEEHNPHRVLGVFFDSDVGLTGPDEPKGTKLTVMMGGHYYSEGLPIPSEEQAIEQAKDTLEKHLSIPRDTPCYAHAHFAEDCIPQLTVGHRKRMSRSHEELLAAFGGRLSVAGGAFSRPGVLPALRAGYEAALLAVETGPLDTGLREYTNPAVPTSMVDKSSLKDLRPNLKIPPKESK